MKTPHNNYIPLEEILHNEHLFDTPPSPQSHTEPRTQEHHIVNNIPAQGLREVLPHFIETPTTKDIAKQSHNKHLPKFCFITFILAFTSIVSSFQMETSDAKGLVVVAGMGLSGLFLAQFLELLLTRYEIGYDHRMMRKKEHHLAALEEDNRQHEEIRIARRAYNLTRQIKMTAAWNSDDLEERIDIDLIYQNILTTASMLHDLRRNDSVVLDEDEEIVRLKAAEQEQITEIIESLYDKLTMLSEYHDDLVSLDRGEEEYQRELRNASQKEQVKGELLSRQEKLLGITLSADIGVDKNVTAGRDAVSIAEEKRRFRREALKELMEGYQVD